MQHRVTYNPDWDTETWREVNFSEEEIASATHTGSTQPTVKELIKAAEKYGSEGILESAIMLSQFQFKQVEDAIKKMGAKR